MRSFRAKKYVPVLNYILTCVKSAKNVATTADVLVVSNTFLDSFISQVEISISSRIYPEITFEEISLTKTYILFFYGDSAYSSLTLVLLVVLESVYAAYFSILRF